MLKIITHNNTKLQQRE